MANESETVLSLGLAFAVCSTPEGEHVHVTIVNIPAGLARPIVEHISPVLNAAIVEFFANLDKAGRVDRSKMQ